MQTQVCFIGSKSRDSAKEHSLSEAYEKCANEALALIVKSWM